MEKLLLIPAILLLSLLFIFYRRWVFRDKADKGPEMTGPAAVKSHRAQQGNLRGNTPTRYQGNTRGVWNYLVTFTLSDGEEIELLVGEAEFRALKDGDSGQLTWQGKTFLEFNTDD